MKVALVVLDAFPTGAVSPETTPHLWSLARAGGWNRAGGVAQLTAATYPNHATLVTGVPTSEHRIMANRVFSDGQWLPAAEVGPATRTIFEACAQADLRSVMIAGDQNLIGVCDAREASERWPPGPKIPVGTRRNVGGYIADDEVVNAAARLGVGSADFALVQLDSVDGARHLFGADSAEAQTQCRLTDAALGALVELLEPVWNELVLFVVSDHDQENLATLDPIDMAAYLPEGVESYAQGTAALIVGETRDSALLAVPGVEGVHTLDPMHRVVWGAPGQVFSTEPTQLMADHGSPRTTAQLAMVAGGHPAAAVIAARVRAVRPNATDWARWAAELLRVDLLSPSPSAA